MAHTPISPTKKRKTSGFSTLPVLTLSVPHPLRTGLGQPPALVRETTNAPSPSLAHEGFPALTRWNEHPFEDVAAAAPGTWVSYTRDPSTYVPRDVFDQALETARGEGVDVQVVLKRDRKSKAKRKKTLCKVIAYDEEKQIIRVESIPVTGPRASSVFPNQSHSWDIPRTWKGNPKYYLMKPEHDPKNKKPKRVLVQL